MLCAHTKQGETVCLPAYTRAEIIQMRENTTYFCPACQEKLVVKVGEEMTPHFAHKNNSVCVGGGGEGEIHERGKWLLYTWLQEQCNHVHLEIFVLDIQQRPDILCEIGNQKIAFEFQYSPISTALLRKRTSMYQSHQIFPIWVLDIRHLQQRSTNRFMLNAFVKQCLFQPAGYTSPLIFFFCTETKQITVLNHILFLSLTVAYAEKTVYDLDKTSWSDLFRQRTMQNHVLLTMWKRDKKTFRMHRRPAKGKQRTWLHWLYERSLHIDYLPATVFLPVKGQMFMNVHLWNWQSRLWYFLQYHVTEKNPFTLEDCIHELAPFMYPSSHFPLLYRSPSPIHAYLQWLVLLGYVHRRSNNVFEIQRPMHPHSHIEEAIERDKQLIQHIQNLSARELHK